MYSKKQISLKAWIMQKWRTKSGKKLFVEIKAKNTHGTTADKWSARKAQLLAKKYKALGGGYY